MTVVFENEEDKISYLTKLKTSAVVKLYMNDVLNYYILDKSENAIHIF